MPIISIIVPVYQAEKTIASCIESILAQTFSDFELLLINDGSKDKSADICVEYSLKDSRIKVLSQQNSGVSVTRNRGIQEALGRYIMFCDSDDYVDPHWCEYMHNAIDENLDSFCTCDVYRVPYDSEEYYPTDKFNVNADLTTYYDIWRAGLSAYTVTKIYDRSKLINSNIRFDVNRSFAEDVEFNVKYFSVCDQGVVIRNKLYYYRANPESLMARKYDDFFPIYSFPFSVRLPLISESGMAVFCDHWFADFVGMFEYIFGRDDLSLIEKLRYNQKVLNSKEFGIVLDNISGTNDNACVIKILRTRNYYLYWVFIKLISFKNKLLKS